MQWKILESRREVKEVGKNLKKEKPSTKKKSKHKFKGQTWLELIKYFEIKVSEHTSEEEKENLLTDFLYSKLYMTKHNIALNKKVLKACKSWLKIFSKTNPTYAKSLWKGLYKIKDDHTFLRYFTILLNQAWY